MVKFILKFPDEWATTKQACRDELIVYLLYIYNLHGISLARRGGLDPARFSTPLTEPPLRFRTGN